MNETDRMDFEQAMGEEFGQCLSPPLPFEDASAHECCEAIWRVLGDEVGPDRLATLSAADIAALAASFGRYFEVENPTEEQVRAAVARTLARWPVGSL
ncbi:hypothetical protein J2T09_004950 [Neorhizobium huautlense]|uniref:Uncharacterized protein n=1 Tax=Neorhizobium huautlense TaxID=67774 RepID=A0ABT9Q108_9HYPH|nr:hypothetical protein [Neorhizobium huautlense]MDP9840170.1 hypothetical protein [Neorhizobium huautlense]